LAVFVHVELQLEQPEVFAVPEHDELQELHTEDFAVSLHPLEHPDEHEEQTVDEVDELQLDEQLEQLDDVALLLQLLLQLITCLSISSPQLFNIPENVLPNATKPKKGTALVTIVLKNSLRE